MSGISWVVTVTEEDMGATSLDKIRLVQNIKTFPKNISLSKSSGKKLERVYNSGFELYTFKSMRLKFVGPFVTYPSI